MLPEVPTICVGQPHALDPSRCPPGRRSSGCSCPKRRATSRAMPPARSPRPPTAAGPKRCAKPMPTASKRSSPATSTASRDNVIARRAYSPADLEAMNINLVGGDPYGGSSTIDQSFLWRPFKSSRQPRDRDQGPLPYRRVDPSRRGPRRRLRLPPGAEAVMDQKVPEKRAAHLDARRDRAASFRALSHEPHHGPLQRHLREDLPQAGPAPSRRCARSPCCRSSTA